MSYPKRNQDNMTDATPHTRDDGWMITPRAISTIATVITILYSLQTPVRYVLALANSVDSLTGRVAALEAIVARQQAPTMSIRADSSRVRVGVPSR